MSRSNVVAVNERALHVSVERGLSTVAFDDWLRILGPVQLAFAITLIAAGGLFHDLGLLLASGATVAFALLTRVIRRRSPGSTPRAATALAVAILGYAIAVAVFVPSGRAALAGVPVIAALMATAHARIAARRVVVLAWAASAAIAVLALVLPTTSAIPPWLGTLLPVGGSFAATALGLLLVIDLDRALDRSLAAAEAREREARAIFDHALDAVITIDSVGNVLEWNARAEELFGWRTDEAAGRPVAELIVPGTLRQAHAEGIERLGRSGHGPIINQRQVVDAVHRDGTTMPVELSVVPLDIADRRVYAGFIRDLSAERAADERLASERRDRSQVADAMGRLRPLATPEATAAMLIERIAELSAPSVVALYRFTARGDGVVMALRAPAAVTAVLGEPLSTDTAEHLLERARGGPWLGHWDSRPGDRPHGPDRPTRGLGTMACVPVVGRSGVVGLLVAGALEGEGGDGLAAMMPMVTEFGAIASALLGDALSDRARDEAARDALSTVISRRRFDVVFQPIVEMRTGSSIGFEALARFHDGTPPQVRFAEAEALGEGIALQYATASAAVDAARALPGDAWLSLNLSGSMLLDARRIRRLATDAARPLVIELTEHEEIDDFRAIRRAMDRLGADIRLAVDDAGAGYAGLRHLIESRASIVKLDLKLVRDVHQDDARQALIAGMVHFATTTGSMLIAEGIETVEERDCLLGLGVVHGQGFLFGRPAPAAHWARIGPARTQAASAPMRPRRDAVRTRRDGEGDRRARREPAAEDVRVASERSGA